MIVVAVDSTTDLLSIAAGSVAGPLVTRSVEGARRHTRWLAPLAEEALGEIGATWADVEVIAISDGPGSFTGLRVSAAWAKAVVRVGGVPLYSASTLLVRAAAGAAVGETVIGVGEALRGELFAAGYRFHTGGIEELAAPRLVADSGALGLTADRIARGPPSAADLIGLIGIPGGARPLVDVAAWEPCYGRLAEAQVKWEQVHGRSLAD